ncbi:2-dehydropantoate 2-reductase-like protein [Patellaria atrata CBS 101060]|uniref:2-dehydropantoate 2-reductase n=1 Tax=Patellaria atrata CBS 101060 TaxID=1346257 RepID=A0A9P4VQ88_9PEZI|nr:2-dehydropantoate 2-reductase-like protein [Patellaria atrata CBS 101060]
MQSAQRIHILGIGNLGRFIAHAVRKSHPQTPITLLFHRPSLVEEWNKAGRCIEIVRNGVTDRQSGFDYELVSEGSDDIENLIVTTKTYTTVPALQTLQHRLFTSSTLIFFQNGMRTVDEVNSTLSQHPGSRPHYLIGILSHGIYTTGTFSAVHAGLGTTLIGSVASLSQSHEKETAFLTNQILESPLLFPSLLAPSEILEAQLQKLAINAIINPVTAVFDCYNGEVFSTGRRPLVMALLSEFSAVTQAILRSENKDASQDSLDKLSVDKLEDFVSSVSEKTAKNISSMRQDVRAGRKTEIDYINGYLVDRGTNFGIGCPLHSKLIELVKGSTVISESDIPDFFGI